MANGMFDLTGWRIMTPEDVETDRLEMQKLTEAYERRWPPAQRRNRCMNCGAFMPKHTQCYTRCKVCDESYDSLQ